MAITYYDKDDDDDEFDDADEEEQEDLDFGDGTQNMIGGAKPTAFAQPARSYIKQPKASEI